MEKNKIIATYLLQQVIEKQTDIFNRMFDIINGTDKEITKDQLISNMKLHKDMLGPLEFDIIKAANLLGIDARELYELEED